MVDPIYFTTPDDFTRGHLVKLKGTCFSLDESKQLVPANIMWRRPRNGLQNGIDRAAEGTLLKVFNRLSPLACIAAVATVMLA